MFCVEVLPIFIFHRELFCSLPVSCCKAPCSLFYLLHSALCFYLSFLILFVPSLLHFKYPSYIVLLLFSSLVSNFLFLIISHYLSIPLRRFLPFCLSPVHMWFPFWQPHLVYLCFLILLLYYSYYCSYYFIIIHTNYYVFAKILLL